MMPWWGWFLLAVLGFIGTTLVMRRLPIGPLRARFFAWSFFVMGEGSLRSCPDCGEAMLSHEMHLRCKRCATTVMELAARSNAWRRSCSNVQRAAIAQLVKQHHQVLLRAAPEGAFEVAGLHNYVFRRWEIAVDGAQRLLEERSVSKRKEILSIAAALAGLVLMVATLILPADRAPYGIVVAFFAGVVAFIVAGSLSEDAVDFVAKPGEWREIDSDWDDLAVASF